MDLLAAVRVVNAEVEIMRSVAAGTASEIVKLAVRGVRAAIVKWT